MSDHHPIMLTIQSEDSRPVTCPIIKWSLHKANWEAYKAKLTELCASTNINGSIDDHALEITDIIIQAAESTIPKTKPHKKKRNYWCYNNSIQRCTVH